MRDLVERIAAGAEVRPARSQRRACRPSGWPQQRRSSVTCIVAGPALTVGEVWVVEWAASPSRSGRR